MEWLSRHEGFLPPRPVDTPPVEGNYESASALLERIKAEKQKLIDAGKIKKEKPLVPINPEDVPFELPEGWVWCRLGEVAEGFQYGTSSKSLKSGNVPVLSVTESGKLP